jgi:hypothetical protein
MNAPICPVSYGQIRSPGYATPQAAIPAAYDLQSLIRAVNATIDALKNYTGNITVNNTYNPPPPFFQAQPSKYYATAPEWQMTSQITGTGYVYNNKDRTMRARVQRTNVWTAGSNTDTMTWQYYMPIGATRGS